MRESAYGSLVVVPKVSLRVFRAVLCKPWVRNIVFRPVCRTKQDHIDLARKLAYVPAKDHGQLVKMCGYDNINSHMHGWPIQRRMDEWAYPLIEIFCKHGCGHPMPESVEWCELQGKKMMDRHGCDGCCAPPRMTEEHFMCHETGAYFVFKTATPNKTSQSDG